MKKIKDLERRLIMRIKKTISYTALFTFFIASLFIPAGYFKASEEVETPVTGTKSEYEDVGYGSIEKEFSPQSFDFLSKGTSEIKHLGSGEIYASATTTTKMSVESIGVAISLEQYKDGRWTYYRSLGSQSLSRSSSVFHSATTTVPTGYNYRVKATHWAMNDGKNEQDNSITKYIYVD